MGDLGSFLTDRQKKDLLTRMLTPGQVFVFFCNFTEPHKEKYLVIAGKRDDLFYVFVINSKINDFIRTRPALLEAQAPLSSGTYTFLPHDSYIDCSKVYILSEDEIHEQLIERFQRVLGNLSQDTLENIINVVGRSKTLSPVEKKIIISNLRRTLE